ncbi:cytochrome c biogenesis protein [Spirulina sp. CS-785/01]|uniref:cytochrome c biogenesis protein n=1 Tax=Spirulina sp. CS-785/01 TaxID=3021716 RepID=UPI00232A7E48|nr:cytochrome c biogenesis protein [Spirulina sp. CS-785/01]MDB9314184.1 cytochrome c biogenesis protein [Spirulina sp. CS-785/01]
MTTTEQTQSFNTTVKRGLRRFLRGLANLKLAIILLLAIAFFSISGTVLEQGQTVEFYQSNYPEHPALFGFLTWKVILALGLDHVYRTWWFLSLLVLFGSSLTACTFTRQLPTLKAARLWKYYSKPQQIEKLALSAELDTGSISSLTPLLEKRNYRVFNEGDKLYARKGIMGRIGPIVVHIGILVILAGAIWGALTGFLAQEVVPSGQTFQVQHILDSGPFASSQVPQDWSVKVNRFWIDYTSDGNIDQFYSDLSVIDEQGEERDRKTIHVNEPLRYDGVTFYQTNWGISAVKIQLNNSPIFRLPMAELETGTSTKFWGTWVPLKPDLSQGVSLLARDLQGTVLLYDGQGQPVGAVREGSSMKFGEIELKIVELVGSTGLQIKADPGVPIVYAGFALLMVGVVMSYVSHSQIWALQQGDNFYLGGKTNRAHLAFEKEIIATIDELRESKRQTPDSEQSLVLN